MFINIDWELGIKDIKDESIDFIISDLPFATTQAKNDVKPNYKLMWKEFKRVLKDEYCPIVLFAGGKNIFELYNSNPKMFKYYWIIDKKNKTNFLNSKIQPLNEVDLVLVFSNGKTPRYYPQFTKGAVNHSVGRLDKDNTNNNYGSFKLQESDKSGMKYPSNLLSFDYGANCKRTHHQQKPIKLLEYLVKTYSKENELGLDITAGSNSFGKACDKLNRDYISFEIDKEIYVKEI